MGRELGRISGPLLADNLQRRGIDLAFDTQLLYFDVTNNRVGINNTANAVNVDLFVSSAANTRTLNVARISELANFTVSGNTIHNALGAIIIRPNQTSNPVIVAPSINTDNLNFGTNVIQSIQADGDINITSSGKIVLNSNTLVTGALEVTGNITFDGNVTLGNSPADTVTFAAEVNSDILPAPFEFADELGNLLITEDGNTFGEESYYNLGSATKRWNLAYARSVIPDLVNVDNLYSNDITVGSLNLANDLITTLSNQNINLVPNGTGRVNFGNFITFIDNRITNTTNSAIVFASTNTPTQHVHWKFSANAGAVVMPVSSAGNYTPEDGTIRFNPTTGFGEVYSASTGWASWNGPPSTPVYQQDMQDNSVIYTLMLGL